MTVARTTVGARRFRCLGGECELTCCSGWQVPVDQAHHAALEARLADTAERRAEFGRIVERLAPGDRRGFAAMRLAASGDCTCLGPDRLCSLQQRFGEPALPDTCSQYPRALAEGPDQPEIWGLLSCPEMVRQCVVAADGLELCDGPAFHRPLAGRTLADPSDPYQASLDTVREAVLRLLGERRFALPTRLFFVTYLAQRSREYFHLAAGPHARPRLDAELERLRSAALLDQLAAGFSQLPAASPLAAALVSGVLQANRDLTLKPLVVQVLQSYSAEGVVAVDPSGDFAVTVAPLWAAYRARRQFWVSHHGGLLDRLLEQHARAFWLKDWFVGSANLLAHQQRYLCQAAVVRFLLFGHPTLVAAREGPPSLQKGAIEAVAVEAIARVSRALEHNAPFLEHLLGELARSGLDEFARTTALIAG